MTDTKRLAFSIIHFLHDQLSSGSLSSDAQESLEGKFELGSQDSVKGDGLLALLEDGQRLNCVQSLPFLNI